jgi:hypothetical protein
MATWIVSAAEAARFVELLGVAEKSVFRFRGADLLQNARRYTRAVDRAQRLALELFNVRVAAGCGATVEEFRIGISLLLEGIQCATGGSGRVGLRYGRYYPYYRVYWKLIAFCFRVCDTGSGLSVEAVYLYPSRLYGHGVRKSCRSRMRSDGVGA